MNPETIYGNEEHEINITEDIIPETVVENDELLPDPGKKKNNKPKNKIRWDLWPTREQRTNTQKTNQKKPHFMLTGIRPSNIRCIVHLHTNIILN